MSVQRREVYLVLKQLSDGRLFYVEGLRSARMYFLMGMFGYSLPQVAQRALLSSNLLNALYNFSICQMKKVLNGRLLSMISAAPLS